MKRLLLGVLLAGCALNSLAFSRVPELPEDIGKWWVGVTMPSFYPVAIREAYGVNESQDWSSPLHSFQQALRNSDLKEVRYFNPDYDGFQLPLGTAVTNSSQIAGTQQLPDYIVLKWTSLTNARFFTTKLDISDTTKSIMTTKITDSDTGRSCYSTKVVFGLLPDGRSKVWLYGCGKYTYITELAPYSENTQEISEERLAFYKKNTLSFKDYAQQYGVSELFPIPWEKVDKVYQWSRDTK